MNPIKNNPFHIFDLVANASARDTHKQQSKFIRHASVGKAISSELDCFSSNYITRNNDLLLDAKKSIESVEDRVFFALFWYVNNNNFDDIALTALKLNNNKKALDIWNKVTLGRITTEKNISSKLNLSSYLLHLNDKINLSKAIESKIEIITSPYFKVIVEEIGDEFTSISRNDVIYRFIDSIALHAKNQLSSNDINQCFCKLSPVEMKYAQKKFLENDLDTLNTLISRFSNEVLIEGDAININLDLWLESCKAPLTKVKDVWGLKSIEYRTIANQIAEKIQEADNKYYGYLDEIEAFKASMKILTLALNYACKHELIEEIKTEIDNMESQYQDALEEEEEEEILFPPSQRNIAQLDMFEDHNDPNIQVFKSLMDKFDWNSLSDNRREVFIAATKFYVINVKYSGVKSDSVSKHSDTVTCIVLDVIMKVANTISTSNKKTEPLLTRDISTLKNFITILQEYSHFPLSTEVAARVYSNIGKLKYDLATYKVELITTD